MAKVMLATGLIVAYGYLMEAFMAWYSQIRTRVRLLSRIGRSVPTAHTYWMMLTCNVFIPQLLWFPIGADERPGLWVIAIVVNVGMWLERYVIVVTSLQPRLPPFLVEHVPRDGLGLCDLLRLDRPVSLPDVPVHPLPAGDLDRRDARAGARDCRTRRRGGNREPRETSE